MKARVYVTKIAEAYQGKKLEHMIGEELLKIGLEREYGKKLAFEPRSKGEHGKPFFTLEPKIHYNLSHSGDYVVCVLTGQEVGIDVQEQRQANFEGILKRIASDDEKAEVLASEDLVSAFYRLWTRKEAYIKWTGEGFTRDVRMLPMERGCGQEIAIAPGYSCTVWSQDPLEIEVVEVQVALSGHTNA